MITACQTFRATILALAVACCAAPSVTWADDADSGAALHIATDEPSYLDAGVGAFNIQSHAHTTPAPEGRVEFRYGEKFLDIGPAVGFLADARGDVYGYAALYGDIAWGRFVLTPLAGLGAYSHDGGENLGGTFAFRESIALAYQFDDQSRLGPQFAHLSNGTIYHRNPGDNELLMTYALPLGSLF